MIRKNWLLTMGAGVCALAQTALAEQVLFTEIMYHPAGNLPEYIEVYNNTATPMDMARWRLRGGVDYDFPEFSPADPTRTFLDPFERIVLSPVDPAVLRTTYGIPANIRIYGPWSGNLDNGGERVTLKDKNDVNLVSVAYRDGGLWPEAADGTGHSLVLVDTDLVADDWRNWTFSSRPNGTPGTEPVAEAETPVENPEVDLSQGIPFVHYDSIWKYNDTGQDLGTAWRSPVFDDSSWPSGPGLFGFENCGCLPPPGIQTSLADFDRITRYLRTEFDYSGPTAGVTISIDLILDDGAILYLNGVEIGRVGANGVVNYDDTASRTVGNAVEEENVITVGGSALVDGRNVLAAEVHQTNPTSSDVVFGARLKISAPTQASLVINEVLPGPAGDGFVEIYNPAPVPINLRDYHLSDNAGNLTQFQVTSDITVPPLGLATVGYAESGLSLANPVTVFLSAPDGETAINAVSATLPLDGRSLGRKPTGSGSWFLFVDPTPGSANASQSSLAKLVRINEVHFSATNTIDWVEFYNASEGVVSLDGLFLSSERDFQDAIALGGSIAPGGRISVDTSFPAGGADATLYLVNVSGAVLTAHHFDRSPAGPSLQAYPEGAEEFYGTAVATRDLPNAPVRQEDVVINEILYDPPSDEVAGEFIELFNRGSTSVDLSGWRFDDGIDFIFPAGTVLPPESYLVVAADLDWIRKVYGAIPAVGNFQGRLSNNGERVRLEDQNGNLVDQVDYKPGGNWPNLANGDGSSMELRNPWMDNTLASAWSDSNESNKAQFVRYNYTDTFRQLRTDGSASDYKELHLHLVGDSHVELRNIQLQHNGSGGNLLNNTDRMSQTGGSAEGWLAQGTHFATHLDPSGHLNIISDGHGDNRPNRVEIDATAMNAGQNYKVSFDARWVAGAPRLVVQTWDHSIATSIGLPIPDNLGTPGVVNSKFEASPVPQVDELRHAPPVPAPGTPVRITARVTSHDLTPLVRLWHRLDNSNGDGTWSSKGMFDDGFSGGDVVAGDGVYTATLTEYGSSGQVAQFYVEALGGGGRTRLPKWGAERPAMFVIDNPSSLGDLRRMRFVMSAYDLRTISDRDSPTGDRGYKFPRLSNHYWNMTLIINERDIIYNCEARNSGSPWTRGGSIDRGKFKVPKDQLFRGKVKYTFDNDAAGGRRHHNRIVRQWLYWLGHPANEHEYFVLEINNSGGDLREEVEPLGNDMLDRIYGNGSEGELYRIDDEWWFTDGWGRSSRNADWSYKGTDNSGRYRTEWMKRSREDEDDYSALISFFRQVNSSYTQEEISKLIDNADVAKMSAVRGYIHDWDSFSLNRGKNGYFYRRSTDGRFMFWHWDSDLAFRGGDVNASFLNGMPGFYSYARKSYNLRLMKHYLARLVEEFARNSPRMNAWLQAEENASSQYSVSSTYTSWFANRESPAYGFIGNDRNVEFNITSNGGNPLTTSGGTVSLNGQAPLRAFAVEVAGHPEARFVWNSDTSWSLQDIRLRTGVNVLTVNAVDEEGGVLHTDTITVTKSGNAVPVVELDADPASWRVSVLESLEVDARDSHDPDGTPLTFSWSASPVGVQLDTSRGDRAVAFFPRPDLYTIRVTAEDADGGLASLERDVAVHAADGFSPFNAPVLEPYWELENVEQKGNAPVGAHYALRDEEGHLVLRVEDDAARPLLFGTAGYPLVWRSLPSLSDWTFMTKVKVLGQVFGDYVTGLMVEMQEGASVRYAFGIENGENLVVKRVTSSTLSTLRSRALPGREANLRVSRVGNALVFAYEAEEDVWQVFHTSGLPEGSSGLKAGMFVASDTAQRLRMAFDYAILIDPTAASDLRQNLKISEIMYDPVGGSDFEFVELLNIGDTPLDLTGVQFTDGISYTFGPTLLAPRQRIVVVQNQAAFASRYSTEAITVAGGEFEGKLNNDGETVELSDAEGIVILTVSYETGGAWPEGAAGEGRSLDLINPAGNLNDGGNWRASAEINGSPGRAGESGNRTVVINEVLTHTDNPFEDAIELRNLSEAPVDIGGWFLSDSDLDFKRFRIPDGTVVPAGGFHTVYEIDFRTNNTLVPFSLSSSRGDELFLSQADAAGNLTGYQVGVSFGPALNGVSFGRYETSVGEEFPPLSARTFGADDPATLEEFRSGSGLPNARPAAGPVVINEIMYRPPDLGGTNDNTLEEYVEIYNVTGEIVRLYDPAYPTNTWRLRGGVDLDFPGNINLLPYTYLLLVNFDPQTETAALASFRALHGIPDTVRIIGPYQGKLSNSGETVRLRRPDTPQGPGPDEGEVPYVLVDEVQYKDDSPWPVEADGEGASLQRRRPLDFANDPVNWRAAAPTAGRANVAGYGFADRDLDGLPDDYEEQWLLNPDNGGDGDLDGDLDGRINRDEFLDGTDPNDGTDVLVSPVIVAQPDDAAASVGSGVVLAVTAEGTAPLRYQWWHNNAPLAGATQSALSIASVQPSDAGTYQVVVHNDAGFVRSDRVTLAVNQPLAIEAQPLSQFSDLGGTVSFTVVAVGTGSLRYQWLFNGGPIPGATNMLLTVSDVQAEDDGNYSVEVGDDTGMVTSAEATLSVLRPPTISRQPASKTAVAYTDVFFSVTAAGEGPFTYQWRLNGVPLEGETNSVIALPNVQPIQAGVYSVEVFNPVSSVVSEGALLNLLIPATITQQPQSQVVDPGDSVTFTVSAFSTSPISYQWQFNDVDIPGATSSTLTLNNVQEADVGNYRVVLTDDVGVVLSDIAVLTVLTPPVVLQAPLTQTVVEGGTLSLSIETKGALPMSYRWRRGFTTLTNEILFSHRHFLTLNNVTTNDAGSYTVILTNEAFFLPGVLSDAAVVTVLPDTDRDGMPDGFETLHGFNPNESADGALDLDGDGVTNSEEYQAGTDPGDKNSFLQVTSVEAGTGVTVRFGAISNRTYTIEYIDEVDGALWQRLTDVVARPTNRVEEAFDPLLPPRPTQRYYRVVTPRQVIYD